MIFSGRHPQERAERPQEKMTVVGQKATAYQQLLHAMPWLSSRSSPVIPVSLQGLDFSSQVPSGQQVMPISLMKPVQLDAINSLLIVLFRILFFQKLFVERGKAQTGRTSICIGSVCVQIGERSSKTNGFPCFETDSSFI